MVITTLITTVVTTVITMVDGNFIPTLIVISQHCSAGTLYVFY